MSVTGSSSRSFGAVTAAADNVSFLFWPQDMDISSLTRRQLATELRRRCDAADIPPVRRDLMCRPSGSDGREVGNADDVSMRSMD